MRNLPRLRARDRRRLRPRGTRRSEDLARRRSASMAKPQLQGVPGRSREIREETEDAARCSLPGSDRGTEDLGAGRRARVGELAQIVARHLVWRAPVLQVAREQGVQDAYP